MCIRDSYRIAFGVVVVVRTENERLFWVQGIFERLGDGFQIARINGHHRGVASGFKQGGGCSVCLLYPSRCV